jgi:hypothetical protein
LSVEEDGGGIFSVRKDNHDALALDWLVVDCLANVNRKEFIFILYEALGACDGVIHSGESLSVKGGGVNYFFFIFSTFFSVRIFLAILQREARGRHRVSCEIADLKTILRQFLFLAFHT